MGDFISCIKGEKREVQVPPFEDVKQKIWQTLFHSRKIFVEVAAEKRFNELSKKYNYAVINNNIEDIFNKVAPSGEITNSTPLNFDSSYK